MLLMPKRLTWSIAEMDSSLHIYKKNLQSSDVVQHKNKHTLKKT